MQEEANKKTRTTGSSLRISFLVAAIISSVALIYLAISSESGAAVAADDYVMAPLLVVVWSLPLYSYLLKRMKRSAKSEVVTPPSPLKGNTLRTYLYIVKNGPSEFRDIQHDLDLSTSSLASYHLHKLMEVGYIAQDEYGRYSSTKDHSTELLEGYMRVGKSLVPELFFLAIVFSVLVSYFSISITTETGDQYYLIATAVSAVVVLWVEALRFWKRLIS